MTKKTTQNTNQLTLQKPIKEVPWETHGIFADHYLRRKLKDTDVWPNDMEIDAPYKACKSLFEKKEPIIRRSDEDINRQEFLDHIISKLGFHYIPHRHIPGQRKKPDYLLFTDESTKERALECEPSEQYSLAVTALEAKRYGHNLGSVSKVETPGRFPHNQIRDYLQDAYDNSTQKPYFYWAILTNGKEWRLYTRNAQTTSYFSIDFEQALRDKEYFKYFWVLFNGSAFIQDSDGQCRLDKLRQQALDHQAELESNLRIRIYNLLEILANGFYNYSPNNIREDDLPELYDACLIFLYRLLFILYAEGRELLPVYHNKYGANKIYRDRFSLRRLRNRLKLPVEKEDDAFRRFYNEIEELFMLINGDNEALNKRCSVPRYNGGLFDPERTPGLNKWKLGNYTLTEVLKGLMFTPSPSKMEDTFSVKFDEYIDYSDLKVRQLGSIYEGLLEYHIELDDRGKLHRVHENRKRKETGSYYTPDYIVQYIIHQTFYPLLKHIEDSEPVKLAKEHELKDNSFAEEVFRLKVLDPAMGSGHFLVYATEYLADEIASHPTTRLAVEKVRSGVSHDWAEIAFWRRRVVESCIYGVDKNPLAVELAKLSLWLTCISSDQPLNFLDHHLRCGNSLVGSGIDEFNRLPAKDGFTAQLFEIKGIDAELNQAIESITKITAQTSSDVDIVKEKKELYMREVRTRLSPFRAIADIRTAFDLGVKMDETAFSDISLDLLQRHSAVPSPKIIETNEAIWNNAKEVTDRYLPFHWELEFPEVFRNGSDQDGFDAIISNPPYVRQESLGELKVYLEKRYETYSGSADLYVHFIEKGINLLRSGGRFGMIVSNKWMRTRYGEKLRRFVKRFQMEKLVDFSGLKVFETSAIDAMVMTMERKEPVERTLYAPVKKMQTEKWEKENGLDTDIAAVEFELEEAALAPAGFALITKEMADIIKKMKDVGTPLSEYVDDKIYSGIKTGFSKAFIINQQTREKLIAEDSKSDEIIKPFVVGADIRKYHINHRERYIILNKIGVQIEEYPAIYKHLEQYQDKLEKRWDKGKHWWELRSCDYYDEFEKPKIVWPDITQESRFTWEDKGYYYNNTCYIMPSNDMYLLGILNSKLIWKYLVRICSVLGDPDKGGAIRQIYTYMKHIPIIDISAESSHILSIKNQIADLVKSALTQYKELQEALGTAQKNRIQNRIEKAEREIDRLVYELYELSDAEIEVVESSA